MVAPPDRGATDHIAFVVVVLILKVRCIMWANGASKDSHGSRNKCSGTAGIEWMATLVGLPLLKATEQTQSLSSPSLQYRICDKTIRAMFLK